ncbi:hypothetical protein NLX85_18150 [Micromonospora sp. A3M-1-15]|uniref:hypothetical protein n=1 Tax=Micromonospora sp. A3M-1-15 TaxID=2962035 RepID=UPI0020B892B9|nr:hypothetical protein [Micromonospora sp. A3M-1-15]MCP3785290.1 hypothetical protein [Micromonospora sp. A3M-1-15]
MDNDTQDRLRRIRGAGAAKRHNARTVAALTGNPGCVRRAVLDAAGVDKDALARHVGFPAKFGQSQFAITRGNAFEAQVKANGYAELLRLLRETLGLEIQEVGSIDLEDVGGNTGQEVRHARSRRKLTSAAADPNAAATFYDHPLLRLDVGGNEVYLEPDLVAFHHDGVFHVVEIKSFAVIDDQADARKVAAAATQSAVYVLALRRLLGDDKVADEVVLVCPKDFSNQPVATKVDVRKQLIVLNHQLSRLTRIERLLAALPPTLTLDLAPDDDGRPSRPAADVIFALGEIEARYAPDCLAKCEMAFFCRHEATGCTAALGLSVREELGGVETIVEALGLADGTLVASDDQAEAATMLRRTARIFGSVAA